MRRYIPAISARDVTFRPSGIRTQCLSPFGALVDFLIKESDGVVHMLNTPSPAAVAFLVIGRHIAERVVGSFPL